MLATIDPAAERVRKLGRSTLHSVGQIVRLHRAADNDDDNVSPADMLTSLIENWIDEAEGRIWFLAESVR